MRGDEDSFTISPFINVDCVRVLMNAPIKQKEETLIKAGTIHDIPKGEGRCFTVGKDRIAIFHLEDGSFRAIDQRCPHQAGPLSDGLLGEGHVICPLHHRRIDLQTGIVQGEEEMKVRTYPVKIQQQNIFLERAHPGGCLS